MVGLAWLWQDLRFGVRSLAKDPRSTLLAILALALGIGSTTVMFSVIYNVIFEPVSYAEPHQLIYLFVHDVTRPKEDGRRIFSMPEFMAYREQTTTFKDIMGFSFLDVVYTNGQSAQLFRGLLMTPNGFEFFGTNPLRGRWITEADAKPGAPPVFAISDRLWAKQWNRDPGILGTTMTLNGIPRTLVGIMPPRFLPATCDLYIPIPWSHTDVINSDTGNRPLSVITFERLKPGINPQEATASFEVVARRLAAVYPDRYPKRFTVIAKDLTELSSGLMEGILFMLMGAVVMLLLIACSNVANLLLARATTREREMALRATLGASRGRLIRQLLVESFVLAAAACLVGCFLAYFGLKVVAAEIPPFFYAETVIELDPPALLFAVGVTFLTTLLCGLAPAFHAARGGLYTKLMGAGKGTGGGFRHGKLRAGLVVVEVALAILLLGGAGLMMRSLFALERVDLGFNPSNVLLARVAFPPGRYETVGQKRQFFQQLLPRLATLPGVVTAAESNAIPPYGGFQSEVVVPGKSHSEHWDALFQLCSESYFSTLGLPVLRGNLLSEADVASARRVVVINQALAKNYFKNEDPIGQMIKFNFLDQIPDAPHDAYFEVIGIVRDSKNQGLQSSTMPEAFMPYTITGFGGRIILVRTRLEPLSLLDSVQRQVWAVDSNVPLTLTSSLEGFLQQYSYAGPQFGLITLGIFAGVGLILVIIGVFGVMAYSVSLQTQEIGVRMALGAQPMSILKMILLKGLQLIAAGIVVGLVASLGLTRLISSQIWGVSPTDPLTFSAVIAIVVVVGLGACLLPARRATQLDPLVALRYE